MQRLQGGVNARVALQRAKQLGFQLTKSFRKNATGEWAIYHPLYPNYKLRFTPPGRRKSAPRALVVLLNSFMEEHWDARTR